MERDERALASEVHEPRVLRREAQRLIELDEALARLARAHIRLAEQAVRLCAPGLDEHRVLAVAHDVGPAMRVRQRRQQLCVVRAVMLIDVREPLERRRQPHGVLRCARKLAQPLPRLAALGVDGRRRLEVRDGPGAVVERERDPRSERPDVVAVVMIREQVAQMRVGAARVLGAHRKLGEQVVRGRFVRVERERALGEALALCGIARHEHARRERCLRVRVARRRGGRAAERRQAPIAPEVDDELRRARREARPRERAKVPIERVHADAEHALHDLGSLLPLAPGAQHLRHLVEAEAPDEIADDHRRRVVRGEHVLGALSVREGAVQIANRGESARVEREPERHIVLALPLGARDDRLILCEPLGEPARHVVVRELNVKDVRQLVPGDVSPVERPAARRDRGHHLAETHPLDSHVRQARRAHAELLRVGEHLESNGPFGGEVIAPHHVGVRAAQHGHDVRLERRALLPLKAKDERRRGHILVVPRDDVVVEIQRVEDVHVEAVPPPSLAQRREPRGLIAHAQQVQAEHRVREGVLRVEGQRLARHAHDLWIPMLPLGVIADDAVEA